MGLKWPTYDRLGGWLWKFGVAQAVAFFGFLAFATTNGTGPYPELMWVCGPVLVLDLVLCGLVALRPDFSVKRALKEYADGGVGLVRELWPLAAVAAALWLGALAFRCVVGVILSLPIWAMTGLGVAVLALVWIGVGTAQMRRGGLLAAAWLLIATPAALVIWWMASR